MSKISNAILETLLEEITDYELLELTQKQINELEIICDRWEDRESIENEINRKLQKIGYIYAGNGFQWVKQPLILLESVGTGIDPQTLKTYPALTDGSYDMDAEFSLEDCTEEWHEALDDDDYFTIRTLKEKYEENLHEQARNLMAELDEKHNRSAVLSLDEYLIEFKASLSRAEIDRIEKLLNKF